MSDAAIRAAFRIYITVCCLLVRSLTYCRCRCLRVRGVPLGMRRTFPEYLDPETSDRWVAADVLVREEPDEEDDDEEGDGEEKEGEEEDDEGYSERPSSDPVVRPSLLLQRASPQQVKTGADS